MVQNFIPYEYVAMWKEVDMDIWATKSSDYMEHYNMR